MIFNRKTKTTKPCGSREARIIKLNVKYLENRSLSLYAGHSQNEVLVSADGSLL